MKNLILIFILFYFNTSWEANYYINDATYDGNDVYTTAVGNNTNNGTSAATPKLTFRSLWNAYGPFNDGDVIYVDAGTFTSSVGGSETQNYGYSFTKAITIRGASNTKTIFDNNYCGIAGAYYFADISANVTLRDIQFTKYSSNQDGQALQIHDTGSPGVTLTKVICNTNGGTSKYATIFIGANSNVTIDGGGMNCNGNVAYGAAGGIDVKGANTTVNITNLSYIGNYKSSAATISNGAALSITASNNTTTIVNISNSLFSGCFTDHDGASGGTFYQDSGILNVTDCIIDDSQTYQNSVKYGGAGYFTGGTTVFTRVKVMNCTNSGGSTYGTISCHGGDVTLANCYFTGNTSDRGNDIYCKSGTITATNTTFGSSANQTATYGGTIVITNCGTPTNQYSSGTFTNNGGSPPSFTTPTTPTFTGSCATGIILPIELIYFNAYNHNGVVILDWKTATEHNNDYFIIEKSLDAIHFTPIKKVKGAGNSKHPVNYSCEDYENLREVQYYRLKQVDFDGHSMIFRVVSVDMRQHNQMKVLYTTNLLGQVVSDEYEGHVLDVLENGTVVRRNQVKN